MNTTGFPKGMIEIIVCQKCHGALDVDTNEQLILDGVVVCRDCKAMWQIRGGILDFLDHAVLDEKRESEIKSRDNEASRYDMRLASRYEKEVISTLRAIGDVSGKNVIEYGAGTGRLTVEYSMRAKGVLACDFSFSSLEIMKTKLTPESNVGLVCADATQLRTRSGAFNVAIATQFYEHLPTQALRNDFLLHCREALALGGRFVSSTYHFDLRRILRRLPQEGMHSGEIFFHYYTEGELRSDIEKYFEILDMHPIDITLPLEAKLRAPAFVGGLFSRFFEHVPYVNKLGHLLLVSAAASPIATIPPKG